MLCTAAENYGLALFTSLSWDGSLATLSVSDFSGTEAESREPLGQSEIIFLGTGTSEGIPRVSCLTNQSKTCPVRLLPTFQVYCFRE